MEFKIKLVKGTYAIRAYDKDDTQIFYTSSRIGELNFEKDSIICTLPEVAVKYEIKDLRTHKIVSAGKINEEKKVQAKIDEIEK